MRPFVIGIALVLVLLFGFRKAGWLSPKILAAAPVGNNAEGATKKRAALKAKAATYLHFAKRKGLSSHYAFLIDMAEPSGVPRFYVYNFKKDSAVATGLVTHGRCGEEWLNGRRYSNKVGSMCTSLGRYKVGGSYQGRFGLAYKLHGLDSSNANAYERYVVLHSHACVPEGTVDPEPICQSDGCPTVSPGFLGMLKGYITKSQAPLLLAIWDGQ